jgi:hypothetical protein
MLTYLIAEERAPFFLFSNKVPRSRRVPAHGGKLQQTLVRSTVISLSSSKMASIAVPRRLLNPTIGLHIDVRAYPHFVMYQRYITLGVH